MDTDLSASTSSPTAVLMKRNSSSNTGTSPLLAASPSPPSTTVYVDSVTVALTSGSQLRAKPCDHAVGGHHMMLSQAGLVWKATRSTREKRFYELILKYAVDARLSHVGSSHGGNSSNNNNNSGGGGGGLGACECLHGPTPLSAEEVQLYRHAAALLVPFMARYFGIRHVSSLKVGSVAMTPTKPLPPLSSNSGVNLYSNNSFSSSLSQPVPSSQSAAAATVPVVVASPASPNKRTSSASYQQTRTNSLSSSAVTALLSQFAEDQQASREARISSTSTVLTVVNNNNNNNVNTNMTSNSSDGNNNTNNNNKSLCPSCVYLTTTAACTTPEDEALLVAQLEDSMARQLPTDDAVEMIVLEDVCFGFGRPCVLDVKMGSRQYGLHPSAAKRLSKERKAKLSTSGQYGVRLAGYRRWADEAQDYVSKSKLECRGLTLDEVRSELRAFLRGSHSLRSAVAMQLQELRTAFAQQSVFRFFTSSLLIVYDADRPVETCRVVMVDFAYTYERRELESGGDPEADYDYDVGYIKALDTLFDLLQE